jgi:hypothetical protein
MRFQDDHRLGTGDCELDGDHSDHGEELTGMYTEEASLDSSRMSTEQANMLRAQSREQSVQEPEQRQSTPVPSDNEDLSYEQQDALRRLKNKKGRAGGLVTDLSKE